MHRTDNTDCEVMVQPDTSQPEEMLSMPVFFKSPIHTPSQLRGSRTKVCYGPTTTHRSMDVFELTDDNDDDGNASPPEKLSKNPSATLSKAEPLDYV